MRLGTQTASLTNHLYSRMTKGQPEPEVGMGATILCWTDRHAATIVETQTVRGDLYIKVREDFAKRVDKNGMSECQDYEYAPNPEGAEHLYRREKDGRWQAVRWNVETKRWNKVDGEGLRIGDRDHYHDFSF